MAPVHDNLFDALSHAQRRRILFDLVEGPQSVNIDSPPDASRGPSTATIERRHVHLPKLAAYGFIEWRPEEDTVEEGPQFDDVEPLLQLLVDNRDAFAAVSA